MMIAVPVQLIRAEDVARAVVVRVDSNALAVRPESLPAEMNEFASRLGMVGICVVLADSIACIIRLNASGDRHCCLSPSD